ncbi:MAG: putative baseplate assembly protein [Actinomycetota bacterium]|nr:putative baseplate assembly protein [Actinomycetota bacterium]
MALPAPNLDDRRFQDIVDEAKRLIPRYCPEWTNHNLADPGVALIELFAWMSEMVLFRVNQVPDRLYVKFLELVGVEPFPPSVARADLTFWLSTVLDHPVVVSAGTEVATGGAAVGNEEVLFSTVEDLAIRPPHLFAARTGKAGNDQLFIDVWDDLRFEGGQVECFTSNPLAPGDALYLGFQENLTGNAIRLQISASIEGIGVDPTDAPLAWDAWSSEAWIPVPVHKDTTGGLNRDGEVVLLLPLGLQSLSIGGTRAFWLRARLTPARTGQTPYQASPRIGSVRADTLGGTVPAEHALTQGPESLGRSDASPGQFFTVARPPILPRREGETVRVVTPAGPEDWTEVHDFTGSGPADRHFTWDGATGTIRFGPSVRYPDGGVRQHGAIPPDGGEIIVTGYRHGGGVAGNVGANTLTVLRSTVAFIDRVTNVVPATGGVDAESVRNAKLRGPLTLRTGQRAVTARDFERLALESSAEVARARCLPPTAPAAPIRLLVVPHVRRPPDAQRLDDFALSDQLVARIADHLDERRTLGTTVEISTPYYQGVTVAALIQSLPGRPAGLVRQRALDLLYRYVNPLVGGAMGEGWPFDIDLNAAPLAQMLEAVEGVERVDEVLLFEYDLRTGTRYGAGCEIIRLDDKSLFLSAGHQIVVR